MSESKLNISRHTNGLLKALGLNPSDVGELFITPTTVTATIYKRNENGQKYLVDSNEHLPGSDAESEVTSFTNQVPATETKTYQVRT